MVFGLIDWLIIGGAALLGLNFFSEFAGPEPVMPVHVPAPVHKAVDPSDKFYVANASPYAYESDGNLR